MGSHTPLAQLEFPGKNVANVGPAGQNHHDQPDTADQAANVENLGQGAKLPPSGYHSHPSFPEDLELMAARFAFFIINSDRPDS
jgi:hypothetical protein